MIRKILLTTLLATALFGCNDNKKQEKTLLDSVIKVHDKVMADDGIVMKNKMQLKNIAAASTIPGVKDSVARYTDSLTNADDAMMTWMNKFNPDFTGKSHQEIMDYLHAQKARILGISARLDTVIASSDKYITKIK